MNLIVRQNQLVNPFKYNFSFAHEFESLSLSWKNINTGDLCF